MDVSKINGAGYIEVPFECTTHQQEVSEEMNGDSKKGFAVALVSFAVGAIVAGVLAEPKTREKLVAAGKKITQRADVA